MGLPEPEYGTDGSFIWITFRRPNSDTNSVTNSVTNYKTDSSLSQKQKEIIEFCKLPRSGREILERIGITYHHKNTLRFITPLIEKGYLKRTIPDKPNSPLQKYISTQL